MPPGKSPHGAPLGLDSATVFVLPLDVRWPTSPLSLRTVPIGLALPVAAVRAVAIVVSTVIDILAVDLRNHGETL